MHIMEGYLPAAHAAAWGAIGGACLAYSAWRVRKLILSRPSTRMLLAACGAFVFVLSALKLPSVTGNCSHPTGTGLGAILFGPGAMPLIGTIVLLFQALLLAHGGLTTLGANVVSMAAVGPVVAWIVYRLARAFRGPMWLAVFAAACLGDLATYTTTAGQLALAYPDPAGGFGASLAKFMSIFALTQIPIAVVEGLLTVLVMNLLTTHNRQELQTLGVLGVSANEVKS